MKNFILILLSYCLIFSCKQKESISGGEVKIITPEYVLDKDIVRFIKEYIQSTDNLYAKNLCMYVYKLSGRYTVIQLESNNYACNNNSGESNIIIDDKKVALVFGISSILMLPDSLNNQKCVPDTNNIRHFPIWELTIDKYKKTKTIKKNITGSLNLIKGDPLPFVTKKQ